MSINERLVLVEALYNSGLDEQCRFRIESQHEVYFNDDNFRGSWKVVLHPLATRIYFMYMIFSVVDSLNIDVATYIDTNYPGCIIFH